MYPALASKIGLLEPDLVLAITAFHKSFCEAKQNLMLLLPDQTRTFGYTVGWVLLPAIAAVIEVRPFLRKVEKLAKLPTAQDPDLGFAKDFLEHEQEMEEIARASRNAKYR